MKNILTFPVRGNPPPDVPGYVRDPSNPYVFRKEWIPCTERTEITPCTNCKGAKPVPFCNRFDKAVEQDECKTCGGVSGRIIEISLGISSVSTHSS